MRQPPPANSAPTALAAAGQALSAGDLGRAEQILRRALATHPQHPELLHQLGLVAHTAGRNDLAIGMFHQAIKGSPKQAFFHHNLAIALHALGKHNAAREALSDCLKLKPGWVEALNTLGAVLRNLQEFEESERVLRRALKKAPKRVDVLFNLAQLLADAGQFPESERLFLRVLERQKNNPVAWDQLGVARAAMGRRVEAEAAYRKAIALAPKCGRFHRHLGMMKRVDQADDPDLMKATEVVQDESLPAEDRMEIDFALAKMYDELGSHQQAFEHARQANLPHHQSHPFESERFERETQAIKGFFDQDYFRRLDRSAAEERPVFIVGMPRSGTTLLEQMLCRHSAVDSAGELFWFQRLTIRHPEWPLPEDQLVNERRDYLRTLTAGQGKARRVIDKMPMNFRHLGLIATLFPNARVIHMRREPLETCRSNYFIHYANGNFFSNNLEDLGAYYGEYLRIMQHWRSVQPLAMHELDYERLVADPRECLTELLVFLDLPFEEACLSHHKGQRQVMTASAWQVRQPIYRSSVDRAEPYRELMAPTLARIAAVESELAEED